MNRNKVQLIGNVIVDPVHDIVNDRRRSRFLLLTSDRFKDERGKTVVQNIKHTVIAWGKIAEIAEKYLEEGSEVAIEGKIISGGIIEASEVILLTGLKTEVPDGMTEREEMMQLFAWIEKEIYDMSSIDQQDYDKHIRPKVDKWKLKAEERGM